ncbi:UNVERIFIED_CONTAM: microneme protein, putative [Hammondia hammondi]|eukprot:XP_008885064.1 microneme protein, putative [Hammondia hammondi]
MKLECFGLAALSAALFASKAEAVAANCFKADTDYFGYDVDKIFVGAATESAEKCQEACRNREDCFYFTYIPERKQCYLKDSQAPNGTVTNPLAISGPKFCYPTGTCFEYMTDYVGYDVQKIEDQSVSQADDCQRLCASNDQCFFWTFIPSKHNCYLKHNGATVGRTPHSEAISGPKSCTGGSPDDHGVPCYEPDTDYFGYDIKIFDNNLVGTAAECYGLCLSFAECKFWTWVPALRNCYLKSEYAPLGRVHAPGTISGPRNCNGSNLPPFVPPPPIYPPTLPYPPPSPYPPYPGHTSTTTPATPPAESCYKAHVDFPTGTLKQIVTDDAYACQKLCQAEAACFFFTYKADILECALKGSFAANAPIPRRHALSGSKYCADKMPPEFQPLHNHIPTPPLPPHSEIPPAYPGPNPMPVPPTPGFEPSCAELNVEYVSDILSVLGADSPKECQTLCKLTASCNFFTYRSDLYRCYLSKSKGTPSSRLNAVAGPKECPGEGSAVPPTASTCFLQNKMFVGTPLSSTEATSAAQCQAKCAGDPQCYYFSFQVMSSNCHLFRQVNGAKEEGTCVSGPKTCADKPTDPCFKEGFYFGQVLKRHNAVASDKECQTLCATFPHSCVGFTYESASQKCFLMSQTDGLELSDGFVSGLRQCPATP